MRTCHILDNSAEERERGELGEGGRGCDYKFDDLTEKAKFVCGIIIIIMMIIMIIIIIIII